MPVRRDVATEQFHPYRGEAIVPSRFKVVRRLLVPVCSLSIGWSVQAASESTERDPNHE